MAPRVRIEAVAAAAGVSIKTVSRVLNREPNVREETRLRVQAIVDELKYTPSSSARSLAGNRSYLIALLYNNPSANYLMEIMGGVTRGLRSRELQHDELPTGRR
jgi:LacI family transcriptional regulator